LASGAADSQEPVEMNVGRVRDYLATRPQYAWVDHVHVQNVASGFSKQTYIVEVDGGGRSESMVLRRDPAFRALRSSVIDEVPILRFLEGSALPVPAPLWSEGPSVYFGTAVLAMAKLPGSSDPALWTGDKDRAQLVLHSLAELLAVVHTYPCSRLEQKSAGAPGTVGASPAEQVRDLSRYWESLVCDRQPLMDEALMWIQDHAPGLPGVSIVHGDCGLHNILVDGNRVSGLLDWELWHLGDAREDLAYAKPFIEPVMPWPVFTDRYHQAGGMETNEAIELYYLALSLLRISVSCFAILSAMRTQPALLDAKAIYVAQTSARRFMIDAVKIIDRMTGV
jgi:aminoglycoside phosphotransferase (APT) family kinase protein